MKIKVIDVSKKIKKNIILDNINLEFNSGKVYGLGEEKGIFRQRKRHIWVLYLSVKKKKELNFHAF